MNLKNELNIGHYVFVRGHERMDNHISRVVMIENDEVRVSNDGLHSYGMGCAWEDIAAVYLTKDIVNQITDGEALRLKYQVQYVHQLQAIHLIETNEDIHIKSGDSQLKLNNK